MASVPELLSATFWAVWVSIGFAVLFNTPVRALWAVALLGAVGYGLRTFLLDFVIPEQLVFSTLVGSVAVGLLGMYFAHRVHTPPIVFTIPAVINMIPGKLGYQFMMGLIRVVAFGKTISGDASGDISEILISGIKTGFILMALAVGVIFPILILNTYSVKNKDLHKILRAGFYDKLRKKHEDNDD